VKIRLLKTQENVDVERFLKFIQTKIFQTRS